MKKLLLLLIALIFLTVSCSSSKKAENDVDILPDEDAVDEDTNIMPDEDSADEDIEFVVFGSCEPNPCENLANSDGTCSGKKNGGFECGCIESYFWNGKECVNPCENVSCSQLNHASGTCNPKNALAFSCDCDEGYFWGYLGCKRIAFPNFCTESNVCYSDSYTDCPDLHYAKLGYCIKHSLSTDESVADEPVVVDDYLKIEWMPDFSDSAYTWYEAAEYCEKLEYAGHDDWRLPTTQELMFIDNVSSENKVLDLWSSTEDVKNESSAWILDFNRNWHIRNKENFRSAYFRCVRGEPVNETVSFNTLGKVKEEVAFDYKNGLAWQLSGSVADSWEKALAYCENSSYSGFSDWRLPNINELASLVNHAKINPATDLPLNLTKNFSWTSTTRFVNEVNVVNFRNGELNIFYKDEYLSVYPTDNWANILCVRNEPCKKGWFWDGKKCVISPCIDNPCKNKEHSDGVCYLNDFESHSCGCIESYFWNGEKCVSPCDPNSCENDKNSTGECAALSVDSHKCGCNDGYFWNGEKCVDPCAGISCNQFEHGTGKCRTYNAFTFRCDCDEGYWWWGKEKGCTAQKPAAMNICTGQNRCFDNGKEIACPAEGEEFFGQDAQYARLGYCVPQSFSIDETVPDEPVVVDNNTGNIWQRKIPPVEELYIEDVKAYCQDLVYGGYDDWRLPSMEDFMTIADYGKYNPALDTEYFPDSGSFWTSTLTTETDYNVAIYGLTQNYYTIFDFDGASTHYAVTREFDYLTGDRSYPHSFNIRCIRVGNFPASKYHFISESFGEKVIWNNHNNLIFAKTDEKYTWKEALKYCSELDYAGISNWRLPNIKELTLNSFGGARTSTTNPADQTSDYSDLPYNLSAKNEKFADTLCVTDDQCKDGKFWNGTKCAKNPCADDPCLSISYSDGLCIVVDEENFACGCVDNYYFWNYDKKECLRSCYNNPCYYDENSDYECYDDKDVGYYCGCKENFSWDPESRKCIFDCNTNPCQNMEHSDGKCHENGNEGSYCGCVEGYAWFPHACLEDLCNPNPCENMANSYGTCEQKYYQTNLGYDIYYRCSCIEGYSWNTKYEECRKTK